MSDELARLGLEVDSSGFVKASARMDNFNAKAGLVETRTRRMGRAARQAGRTIGRGLGLTAAAVAAVTANAVRMGAAFESELTKMNTLVGVSRAEINGFRDDILALGPAVGKGPSELAEAMFAITSAGARGQQAMDLLEASSKAAALGLGNTRDIALTAGAAVTAFGSGSLTASQAVEIMVGTVEQGNLEASELAGSLGKVLSLTAAAGVSFQDAGAFIAAFTRQGVQASEAVTGLRGVLATLVREPTEKAKQAFKDLDTSAAEFKDEVRSQGFINAFQGLIDRADAAGVELGTLIPEVEALAGAMAVFTSEGESAADIAGKVGAAVGTLEDRFATAVEQDPALAFAMVRAEFEAMSVRLGSDLLPVLGVFLDKLNGTSGEADVLAESLDGLLGLLLMLGEHAILVAGMFAELGKRVGQVAAMGAQFAANTRDNFDLSDLLVPGKALFSAFDAINDTVEDSGVIAEAAGEDIQGLRDKYFELAQSLRASRLALDEKNDASEDAAESETMLGNILSAVDDALQRQRVVLTELEPTKRANAAATREAAAAAAEWEERLDDLEAELGGPLSAATREYESQVREAIKAFNDGEQGADGLRRAVALFRREFIQARKEMETRELEQIAREMAETEQAMQSFRDENARLAAELDGTAAVAELDFVQGVQAAMTALAAGEATIDDVRDRVALLREEFERTRDSSTTFADALGSIGNGFAQSLFQGQGATDALVSGLQGFAGQQVSGSLGKFFETAAKDGIGAALEDDEITGDKMAGFALAMGQAIEGNLGQAAFTAIGSAIGGQIGAAVGSIVGDLLFGDSVPKFQARGTRATRATDAGTDLTLDTAFGDFQLAFRGLSDAQKQAVEEGYTSFFNFLGDLTSGLAIEQQQRIADAVQEFGISSRSGPDSPEAQMKLLLADIVATFPPFFGELVNAEATLDARLAKFADLLALDNAVTTGRGIGGLGFEELAVFLDDAARAGETLTDALERIKVGFDTLTRLGELTGNALRESALGLAQLGAELTALSPNVQANFNRIFDTFFSEEQNLEATVATSGRAGERMLRELLAGIDGIDFSDEFLTRSGFADLLEQLTAMDLSPEQLALLGEAGVSIADLIDAEERLAEIRDESTESMRDAAGIAEILAGLDMDATRAGLSGLDLALFDTNVGFDELRERLIEMGATDEELARLAELRAGANERLRQSEQDRLDQEINASILETLAPARLEFAALSEQVDMLRDAENGLWFARLAAQIQIEQFVASLEGSIASLAEQFNNAGQETEDLGNSTGRAVRNMRDQWLRAIDSIEDALNSQLVGNNSSLTPIEKQLESVDQFTAALAAAQGGDLDAARSLPGLFNEAIDQAANVFGTSTSQFGQIERELRAALESADLPVPPDSPEQETAANTRNTARSADRIQQEAFQQTQLAFQLADQIGILSQLTGKAPNEIADEFGLDIGKMIEAMTGELPNETGKALSGFFDDLIFETNAQLNEFAQLEQVGVATLRATDTTNEILRSILRELGGADGTGDEAGAVEEGSGSAGGDASFGGGSETPLARGGIVTGPTRALIGEAGPEAVLPLTGVNSLEGMANMLGLVREAIVAGNRDRRDGVEMLTDRIEKLEATAERQERRARIDSIRPTSKTKNLTRA